MLSHRKKTITILWNVAIVVLLSAFAWSMFTSSAYAGGSFFVKLDTTGTKFLIYDYPEYEETKNLVTSLISTVPLKDENGDPINFSLTKILAARQDIVCVSDGGPTL